MNRKSLAVLAVPMVGVALLAALGVLRQRPEGGPARPVAAPVSRRSVPAVQAPPLTTNRRAAAPAIAPPRTIATAMDEARLKTTYQNYRTSLAIGNQPQSEALYLVLTRERSSALKLAEADLAQAHEEFDRSLAQKALETLRR